MRRFLITNHEKFSGTAEIFYNKEGVLCRIECTNTNMDAATITAFKSATPATIERLAEGVSFSKGTSVVEVGYRVSFDEWWKLYDKKINRVRCIPLYEKLNDADTVLCFEGTKVYNRYLAKLVVRQKLDPENWIKNQSWLNEWK